MSNNILLGAGPFYFEGSKTGILFVHGGGGGTCADLKSIAEDLHKKGNFTISVPLLPGYGTTPEELRFTPIEAWKDAIDKEIALLKENCDKIIMGGHSMGGALTLIAASKQKLDGIFTISAPVGIRRFAAKLVPFFKLFIKFFPIPHDKFKAETDGKWVGYKKIPLNIAIKIKKLIKEVKENLIKIECPALIMQGRLDIDIKENSLEQIYTTISSKNKKKVWLENNDHPILDSPDHNQIISEIVDFIEKT